MNRKALAITDHAWERFITRLDVMPPCPMAFLLELIRIAKEEDIGAGAVIRLMNNKMEPARYYTAKGWRLVTTEDGQCLITVERIIHKKPKKFKPRRKKNRRGR